MELASFVIDSKMTVIEAMSALDKNGRGIVFVCEDGTVKASLTDGDIRRHILGGGSLTEPAEKVANPGFVFVREGEEKRAQELMRARKINGIPVLTAQGKLTSIAFLGEDTVQERQKLGVPVVIMAGGKGTRLYPYTKVLPKPLIPVGDLTITEHIMQRFAAYGCDEFMMIVNHKKNMIKSFFSDEQIPFHVHFVDEDTPLGTGGGLKLLQGLVDETFFLTNCDILIEGAYDKMYRHHKEQGNILTMACATKQVTIPYGTVEIDGGGDIISLREKPSFSFLTNTGFYIVEPRFLDYIPDDTFIHITDIIQLCIDNGEKVGVYPISEHAWMDMGQLEELERMRKQLGVD